ncbi:hypothetical protein ACFWEB_02800 [Streptomyces parvus]|uniref:hypothetical protein n=1 Tax=Streptomyces parvus TaxID=66428 RepID=UPI0036635DAF
MTSTSQIAPVMGNRNTLLASMRDAAAGGIKIAGRESVVGMRLDEMQDLYGFMQREMAALIDRWREQYDAGQA